MPTAVSYEHVLPVFEVLCGRCRLSALLRERASRWCALCTANVQCQHTLKILLEARRVLLFIEAGAPEII
jgi:hypothetical protein